MGLKRKSSRTTFMVLMVLAVMSATIILPVSAQAELLKAGVQWKNFRFSEHLYQIFYARVRNAGTESVYTYVVFEVIHETGSSYSLKSSIILLYTSRPFRLRVEWKPRTDGMYNVHATGYYSTDHLEWHQCVNTIYFDFVASP